MRKNNVRCFSELTWARYSPCLPLVPRHGDYRNISYVCLLYSVQCTVYTPNNNYGVQKLRLFSCTRYLRVQLYAVYVCVPEIVQLYALFMTLREYSCTLYLCTWESTVVRCMYAAITRGWIDPTVSSSLDKWIHKYVDIILYTLTLLYILPPTVYTAPTVYTDPAVYTAPYCIYTAPTVYILPLLYIQ